MHHYQVSASQGMHKKPAGCGRQNGTKNISYVGERGWELREAGWKHG